ncbi:carboxypeptidase regulatory-like domain-containing protein [Acidobacteria bacterium AB60]|nr:carboxypeptidase regulatory-like domain-containing protein [Acidobacteria bacterium AB60]
MCSLRSPDPASDRATLQPHLRSDDSFEDHSFPEHRYDQPTITSRPTGTLLLAGLLLSCPQQDTPGDAGRSVVLIPLSGINSSQRFALRRLARAQEVEVSKKLLFLMIVVGLSIPVQSQVATDAILTGTVTDASGSLIEGAKVVVTNRGTGVTTETETNKTGQYRTPPLKIGEYTVDIQRDGFKQFNEAGVVLDIGAVHQINAVLEVGKVVDTVQVQASTEELLQKSDSSVGTVITNQDIEELPLNGGTAGRDYLQLAALSPGTTPAVPSSTGNGGGIGIGGLAGTQAAFLLDGIDNNNQEILTAHSGQKEIIKPSIDAISEFKVLTTSYSSEFGRSASGVVSVDTKSGTNDIHGSAFEFLRNDYADALPDFSATKLPFKYNDFGGTLGGPVRRDHSFLFGDVEFFRLRTQSTVYSLVPTDAQKSGQFTTPIYDPSTYNGTSRTQFAGNQISSSIDPIAKALLPYFPAPNFAGTGALASKNYFFNQTGNQNNYRWDVRFDQALSAGRSLFARYSSQQVRNALSSSLPPLNGQYYAGSGAQSDDSQGFVVGFDDAISSHLVASARVGWNRIHWTEAFPKQSLTGIGIPGVATSAPGFSEILVANFATIGVSNVPNADDSQDREALASLTWIKGAHTLKFGWQEYWLQTNFNSSQLTSGIFSFNGQYTAKTPTATPTNDQRFADFLLGAVSKEQLSSPSILNFRSPYSHFYTQDDWKATRSLTLNLGIRYELSPPAVDKYNKIANFDEDTDPSNPRLVYANEFGNSRADRALQNVSYTSIAPRFGFAYSPEGSKTVIRGGYGIFYANAITVGGMQSMENNPPVNKLRLITSPSPLKPSQYLQQGFASDALSLTNANGKKNVTLVSFDRHSAIPIDQQWNVNVQHALPFGIVAEAGYFANKFDHNWWQVDGNPAPATPTATLPAGGINANRRYKSTTIPGVAGSPTIYLGTVSRVWKEGWSHYNGLQVKAEKRYSKGMTFLAAYAYSKNIGIGDTQQFQNPDNIEAERAVTSTDMRHHFVGSGVYNLPFGRGSQFGSEWNRWLDGALGGWAVSPILTLSSGTPLNLTESKNPSNSGGTADRPNLVGKVYQAGTVSGNANCAALGGKTHSAAQWFNPCAVEVQPSGTYGNAPRNIITSPGLFNLDFAVHKTFGFTERLRAQLRLESFNITNTPHYGAPALDVQSPTTLGTISSVNGNPRQNQVALKLLF